jgi:hypothetical protein
MRFKVNHWFIFPLNHTEFDWFTGAFNTTACGVVCLKMKDRDDVDCGGKDTANEFGVSHDLLSVTTAADSYTELTFELTPRSNRDRYSLDPFLGPSSTIDAASLDSYEREHTMPFASISQATLRSGTPPERLTVSVTAGSSQGGPHRITLFETGHIISPLKQDEAVRIGGPMLENERLAESLRAETVAIASDLRVALEDLSMESDRIQVVQQCAGAEADALWRAACELDAVRGDLARTEAQLGESRVELVRARNEVLDLVEGRARMEANADGLRADLLEAQAALSQLQQSHMEQGLRRTEVKAATAARATLEEHGSQTDGLLGPAEAAGYHHSSMLSAGEGDSRWGSSLGSGSPAAAGAAGPGGDAPCLVAAVPRAP